MTKLILLLLFSQSSIAATTIKDDLDGILDRLEEKLNSQRSNIIEPYQVVKKNSMNPTKIQTESQIVTEPEEAGTIHSIEDQTKKLEQELDGLTEKVNLSADKIAKSSRKSPSAKITVHINDSKKYRAKNLRITLNDSPLYIYTIKNSINNVPEKFQIYDGDIPQGTHKIRIVGTWITASDQLTANQDFGWSTSEEFDLISEGLDRKKTYTLDITAPTSQQKTGAAKLIEGDPL